MKTLEVAFENYNDKYYHYLVEDNVDVAAGDYAVVHNGTVFKIVKILKVFNEISHRAVKSAVSVINKADILAYDARNELVASQKDKFARLEQLLKLENENNKYRVLAASNAEAAAILAELGIK